MSHLDNIQREYVKIIGSTRGEPCIDNVTWKDVSSLYRTADEIKNHSPVFASKMCHFIFPKVFIVMDNLATGTTDDYEYYWEGSVREWTEFNEKEKAIGLLSTKIVKCSSKPIHLEYPFETKIIELCNIGKKHGRSGQTDTNNNMG